MRRRPPRQACGRSRALIVNYGEVRPDALWSDVTDLLGEEPFDAAGAYARIFGRDIGRLIAAAPEVRDRMLAILREQLAVNDYSAMVQALNRFTVQLNLMIISEESLSTLGSVITGDSGISPYRSGPDLVEFFNRFGGNDEYGRGFPSRWWYAEERLRELNGTPEMEEVLLAAVDRRSFFATDFSCEAAVERLNQYLEFDGLEILPTGRKFKVARKVDVDIEVDHPYNGSKEVSHIFIVEQIEKCDRKLRDGDFDGAVTNARSLVEAVLADIERKYDNNPPDFDGNLPRLYKRVQNHLNLTPGQEGLADSLTQILSGLTSITNGLASLRNSMSDSHVISYRPAEHHARLAVNAAKTLCHFLFDSQEYQEERQQKEKGAVPTRK